MSWLKKLFLGSLFSVLLLALTLGVLELVLRAVGYGHSAHFWRVEKDAQGNRWIRENPWVTAPFFSPELIRRPPAFRLPEKKSADSYRIFVLGSSAAMGDPESSFSMARVLETMLRAAYPEIHFEVVNAGITAINSHVVRGIAEDCSQLEPDLFVVYEGNNEVIGPFGPGTVFTPFLRSPSAIRAAIFLRGLRIGQALTGITRGGKQSRLPEEWGGMKMFLEHAIGPRDPRLTTTQELFENNLRAIARAGTRVGATVILGTVLTNEKDFAPFQSRHAENLSPENLKMWENDSAAGRVALNTGDWYEAERQFRSAITIDVDYAETHFHLGQILEKEGGFAEAKTEFQRALDDDWLRFRTDSKLNAVIRTVAKSAGSNVVLDDLVGTADSQVANGITGDELLYEHVHLNFRGTYLVARDLFKQVGADLLRRGRVKADRPMPEPIDADLVRSRLAFTIYDQAMIGKELLGRFQGAPFIGQSTNQQRVAAFRERDARANQLLNLPQSAASILAIYDQAIAANPDDWILWRNDGMALLAFNHADLAKIKLQRALEIIPDDPDALYTSVLVDQKLGDPNGMNQRLLDLRRVAPRYPGLEKYK